MTRRFPGSSVLGADLDRNILSLRLYNLSLFSPLFPARHCNSNRDSTHLIGFYATHSASLQPARLSIVRQPFGVPIGGS